MTNQTQFDDQLIDQFLGLGFGQNSFLQVSLNIYVQEGRNPAQAHGGTILFFNCGQETKVQPLYSLSSIRSWLRDVEAVT